jgi:hypothetical protein
MQLYSALCKLKFIEIIKNGQRPATTRIVMAKSKCITIIKQVTVTQKLAQFIGNQQLIP